MKIKKINCLTFGFWSLFNPRFNTFLFQNVIDDSLQVFMMGNQVSFGQVVQIVEDCCEVEVGPCKLEKNKCVLNLSKVNTKQKRFFTFPRARWPPLSLAMSSSFSK